MQLTECPHCLNHVLPTKHHACPSCSKDTRAQTGSAWAMLTVTPTTRFPHRCFACEAPTDRTEIIKAMGYGADPWWVRALAGAAFLFKPKLFLTHADVLAGDPELFRVEVPRCAACSKKGRLAPDYVNTKQGTVTLKVRRGFAAATRALAHDGEGTGG